MQRHLNIRRAFLSIENRTGVLFRDNQRKRIYTISQSLAFPNAKSRASIATVCDARSGSVRRNRLGPAVYYSTAPTEPDPGLMPSIFGHDSQMRGGEAIDQGDQGDSLAAGGILENDAMSGKEDYYGLGESLMDSPRKTLHHVFAQRDLLRLHTKYKHEPDKEEILCTIECRLIHNGNVMVGHGTDVSKAEAERKAAKSLDSQLHVTGSLQTLTELRDGLKLKVKVEDDLIMIMRRALRDLTRVGQFPMPETHRPQLRLPAKDSSYLNGRKERDMRQRSGELLSRQRKRLKAGLPGQTGALPISVRKDQIVDMILNNTYSILVAETGAGKSTQLPQFLFDHAIAGGSGAECKVLCVQPRRIATVSLADRVSKERNEKLGESVGYQIRFDSRLAQQEGAITYCTTGILLQQLQWSPSLLDSVSYILLDEVHEREVELDLLMLLLKRHIDERQAIGAHTPRIVIMSATLDVDLFSSYFQNRLSNGQSTPAPHLHIPGRSFSVTSHYIEDFMPSLLQLKKSQLLLKEPYTQDYLRIHGLLSQNERARPDSLLTQADSADSDPLPSSEPTIQEEDPLVPYGLICLTINHILSTTNEGAILVFLPGLRHIDDVETTLKHSGHVLGFYFSDKARFKILSLHSSLPENQLDVFGKVEPGCRRIILATNIAETSITIPDVRYVVDTGKVHQQIFDPRSRVGGLTCCWVSQSSVSQRAGRAGRVGNGEYFALYSRNVYGQLRINMVPAIQRQELQATCLIVKKALPDFPIQDILQQSIEPPDNAQVQQAVKSLQSLRALDDEENLTTLGNILLSFPLDPCCGKLVLLGIIFRCLDPLLIIASLGSNLLLFRMGGTDEMRQELREIRHEYSENTWSDHISLINAFKDVRAKLNESGFAKARERAFSRQIHWPRFNETLRVAKQIMSTLKHKRLIPWQGNPEGNPQFGSPELNANSWRSSLIKALILHTMYPNLATAPPSRAAASYTTQHETKTAVPTSSVNYKLKPRCLFIFNQKHRTPLGGALMLLDTTHVTPLVACLLGGRLQGSGATLRMDDWLEFNIRVGKNKAASDHAAGVIIEFRKALESAIMAAFNALTSTTGEETNDSISTNLILVLDQDVDPVYKQRNNAEREWI